ncbi:MAG: FecR family protein [Cyclobacteriaceae bacterium]|jgi:transmembrane sensor|nr:FecR domain-containing protein [Flammeovirgaceae bacterium]
MEQKRIAYLIKKWNSDEISPEERKELEDFWDWASKDDTLFNSLPEMDKERIRISMQKRIFSSIEKQPGKRSPFLQQISWPMRIAATLLVGALAFWIVYNPVQFKEIRAEYSQQRNVELPDGSTVILNGNSSVRYQESWSADENREIWINGEGFFDVKHTQNHQKFIVHVTNTVNVQVLGTRFNVKIRRGKTEVMLEQGKVQMNMKQAGVPDTVTLQPNQLVTLEKQVLTKKEVNPTRYSSWKMKKMYFDQTPLSEVAKFLEDTHGYKVEFKNKALQNRKLSGELQSGKVEDILIALRESLQIQITKDGNKLLFN